MRLFCIVNSLFFLIFFHGNANAYVGAFWLGIDAKVETTVKVDQRVLDTINSLPLEIRKQFVAGANEVVDKMDAKIKEDIVLFSAEMVKVSEQASIQWECTAKNVVDKIASEIKSSLPRWNIFADRCERLFIPDKLLPGPAEKVSIAECWTYEALPENTSPALVAMKLSRLEMMSADAACMLRQTQSGPKMWQDSAKIGLRYTTWSSLEKTCSNPKACYTARSGTVSALLKTSDVRDIGNAAERLAKGMEIGSRPKCDLKCFEEALVEFHTANAEVARNKNIRDSEAKVIASVGVAMVGSAQKHAAGSKAAAASPGSLGQQKGLADLARKDLDGARNSAKMAREKSSVSEPMAATIDRDVAATEKILAAADVTAAATAAAEARRIDAVEAAKLRRALKDCRPVTMCI